MDAKSPSTSRRGGKLAIVVMAVCVCLILAGIYVPSRSSVGRPRRLGAVTHSFRSIEIALRQYHLTHGRFPPAYVSDENGRPMHSWRVLILREIGRDDLYELYDFNQPWDSPANLEVMKEGSGYFYSDPRLGDEDPTLTTYQLLVDPGSALDLEAADHDSVGFDKSLADRVILVENLGNPVAWTEPVDLSLEELRRGTPFRDAPPEGIVILTGDGVVRVVTEAEMSAVLSQSRR